MMTSEYCDSEVKRVIYHIKFESPDFAALEPSRIRCKEDMIRFNIFLIKVTGSAYISNCTYPLC